MSIRRMFMTIAAVMSVSAVFADSSSVTSRKYVDDFMTNYQDKIPGSGTDKLMIYDESPDGIGEKNIVSSLGSNTSATDVPNVGAVLDGLNGKQETINGTAGYVMTGTGTAGSVDERAIYDTNTNNMDALVTAETVNTAVINAVNSSLIRVDANGDVDPNGTLWQIADDLTALSVCSNYATATGTGVQDGTPTPTNPVIPVFYQQGGMILRAVGNYADSYDANTNKITRRVGVKVLDGTEDWVESGESGNNNHRFNLSIPIVTGDNAANSLCTHINNIIAGSVTSQSNRPLIRFNSGRLYWYDSNNTTSLTSFKQWLADQYAAGTPVVVYYPLETPVTEDMPPRCQ